MARDAAAAAGTATGIAIPDEFLHGVIAEYRSADDILRAARRVRDAGYTRVDAYSPFAVEGLDETIGFRDHWVPLVMFIFGCIGAIGGFSFLIWSMSVDYPMNIGGRPIYLPIWPSLIPITFEITVLLSALGGVIGMFWLNGLPQPYHPVFDAPDFDRASSDRFFLCIENDDEGFDRRKARRVLEATNPVRVSEVERRR